MNPQDEFCKCDDCIESNSPCYFSCDGDNECQGCRETRESAEDALFDEQCALGYI